MEKALRLLIAGILILPAIPVLLVLLLAALLVGSAAVVGVLGHFLG